MASWDLHRDSNNWKPVLLGAVAGLAGVVAMNLFMKKTSASHSNDKADADQANQEPRSLSLLGRNYREEESPTAAAGRIAYTALTHREPESPEMKSTLSDLVHWGYGMNMGVLYGVTRGGRHGADVMGGLVFGTGLWFGGDEVALPLLGLTDSPRAQPASTHLQSLGAHLVYGLVMAATFQTLRKHL